MRPIYNFHVISDLLACSGQPSEEQLPFLSDEGYGAIVNLGLADGKYALPDETGLVSRLGMAYHHIPVQFNAPQIEELSEFIGLMNHHKNDKTLVHCAANFRASVFTGLYLFSQNQLDEEGLESFIGDIWQPDAIWQSFIEEGVAFITENRD